MYLSSTNYGVSHQAMVDEEHLSARLNLDLNLTPILSENPPGAEASSKTLIFPEYPSVIASLSSASLVGSNRRAQVIRVLRPDWAIWPDIKVLSSRLEDSNGQEAFFENRKQTVSNGLPPLVDGPSKQLLEPSVSEDLGTFTSEEHKAKRQRLESSALFPLRWHSILPLSTGRIEAVYNISHVKLGYGGSGKVYVCKHKESEQLFACKTILKKNLQTVAAVENVLFEIAVAHKLRFFKSLVCVRDAFEDKDHIHLVMEFCNGGDLFSYLKNAKLPLEEKKAQLLVRKIADALSDCHSQGIVHRDIKPENILLHTGNGLEVKLADFGLARFMVDGKTSGVAGSALYVAPEIIQNHQSARPYDCRVDVWSLGVILFFMLSGCFPFQSESMCELLIKISTESPDFSGSWTRTVSPKAVDLLKQMLANDPKRRPNVYEMLNHPWMQ